MKNIKRALVLLRKNKARGAIVAALLLGYLIVLRHRETAKNKRVNNKNHGRALALIKKKKEEIAQGYKYLKEMEIDPISAELSQGV